MNSHEEDGIFIIFVSSVPHAPPPAPSGWYFLNSLNVRIKGKMSPIIVSNSIIYKRFPKLFTSPSGFNSHLNMLSLI